MAAAAGLAVLDQMEEQHILKNVNEKGAYLAGKLEELRKAHPWWGTCAASG